MIFEIGGFEARIALGEASSVVSVVLNMVVNAAIAIITYAQLPKLDVYMFISCPAKTPALSLKVLPLLCITIVPNNRKPIPKKMVPM